MGAPQGYKGFNSFENLSSLGELVSHVHVLRGTYRMWNPLRVMSLKSATEQPKHLLFIRKGDDAFEDDMKRGSMAWAETKLRITGHTTLFCRLPVPKRVV